MASRDAAALARVQEAKRRQEAALAAKVADGPEQLASLHARAESHGKAEKTAGTNGQVGTQRWLETDHGQPVRERLATRGAPTVDDALLFSPFSYMNRTKTYSTAGRTGSGDSYGALQFPYMLAKYVTTMTCGVRYVHRPRRSESRTGFLYTCAL
jgi:hypothetical protein